MTASLFPPSAVISLTDDNSTFFLARPAAFGPDLPPAGLSGRLWVGSGFNDDAIQRGDITINSMPELGCSDVPGWDIEKYSTYHKASAGQESAGDTTARYRGRNAAKDLSGSAKGYRYPWFSPSAVVVDNHGVPVVGKEEEASYVKTITDKFRLRTKPPASDGTDDYLHHPLPETAFSSTTDKPFSPSKDKAPPYVDLRFLQDSSEIRGKVVLLGRGGCGFLEKVKWAQRRGAMAVIVGDNMKGGSLITMYARGDTSNISIPAMFTSHTTAHLLTALMPDHGEDRSSSEGSDPLSEPTIAKVKTGAQTAPSSSFSSALPYPTSLQSIKTVFYCMLGRCQKTPAIGDSDDDEWRRPKTGGLDSKMEEPGFPPSAVSSMFWKSRSPKVSADKSDDPCKTRKNPGKGRSPVTEASSISKSPNEPYPPGKGSQETTRQPPVSFLMPSRTIWNSRFSVSENDKTEDDLYEYILDHKPNLRHDGLWVTLTPTSAGSSPFFDTLLILVISPLITLSVIYLIMLIRTRIHRRRHRAPKSIIDRLPVRTYSAIPPSDSASIASSKRQRWKRAATAAGSAQALPTEASSSTPTSPLLTRSPMPSTIPPTTSTTATATTTQENDPNAREKADSLLWQQKYQSRQSECAICLEEYVEGAKVMGLPCGHEFHPECM